MNKLINKIAKKHLKTLLHNIIFNKRRAYKENYYIFKQALEYAERKLRTLLINVNGASYQCMICGSRGFTPRGIFLHLIRKHENEIIYLIEDEIEEYLMLHQQQFKVKQ